MVFEQFLESKKIKKNFLYILLLGLFYVLISNIISEIFFPGRDSSLVIIFITTIFLIPSIYSFLNDEEEVDSKCGLKFFLKNHKYIAKLYFALFIGIFLGFILLNNYSSQDVMSYQVDYLKSSGDINDDLSIIVSDENSNWAGVLSYISHNTMIILIAFILSIFYGAGAIFLLIFNASIFSAYLSILFQNFNSWKVSFASLHMIPELFGFFLAAVAGGIISRAIFKEEFMSEEFKNVLRDALILLLISFLVIVISAILEAFVVIRIINLL